MHVALIADIHGNLAALDAVLADIRPAEVDRVVCLGDVAATGPQPREVLARVRALGCPVVMGNADAELLAPAPSPDDGDGRRVAEIDRWCAAQLDDADRAFLRSFAPTVEVDLGEGRSLLCCHGSPRSYDDVIAATTPDEAVREMLAGRHADLIAGGHWHFQMLRRFEGSTLVNPGSVGLAYDLHADGEAVVPARAEYAIVVADPSALEIRFRRLPYDQAATLRAMVARRMPHAGWWAAGWAQRDLEGLA